MTTTNATRILGMGKCLPANKVLSSDLEKSLGIPAGWAVKYSGVAERYHVTNESGGELGAKALEMALQQAGCEFGDLDLLLCGCASYDFFIPNMACVIKEQTAGGKDADVPALSLDATCLSFVMAVDTASRFLDGKQYKKIAVVSVEIASKGLNPKNWETATLFGDGAAAAVLSWEPGEESGILKAMMQTYSEGIFNTIYKGGGNTYSFRDYPYDPEMHSFSMNGKNLLRMAAQKIPEFMESFFADLDMDITDVDLVIPHQASKMGLHIFTRMYDFREDQIYANLDTHGNCISASIPMALHDAIKEGRLQRGQTCLICGTSAGFSIGGVLFRY